jgi:hypothetical protein
MRISGVWVSTLGRSPVTQVHLPVVLGFASSAPIYRVVANHVGISSERIAAPGRNSDGLGLLHPRRDIALAMQHTPDINVLWTLDIKYEMWIVYQWPEAQAGQV